MPKPNPFKILTTDSELKAYAPPPTHIKEAFAFIRGDIPEFIKILWDTMLKYNIEVDKTVLSKKRGDLFNWSLKHKTWAGSIAFRVSNDAFGEQIRCIPRRLTGSELIYNTEFILNISEKILPYPSMVIRECKPVYKNKINIVDEGDEEIKEMYLDPNDMKLKAGDTPVPPK